MRGWSDMLKPIVKPVPVKPVIRVIEVLRVGVKNASVKTDTGIKVRVPVELGVLGAELDELRVYEMRVQNKVCHRYLPLTSFLYKRNYAKEYASLIKDEDWFEFIRLSKWYFRKFFRCGWIRGYEFDEWLDNWFDLAYESGTHFRMAQMDTQHKRRYMYSCIKGFLCAGIKRRIEEPRMVSFDVLESMRVI